ncbi:hypothetical protein BBF93_00310 [Hyphomonas sp. CACIAM 19H1]|uniref:hypothetical protein n=1 Tax=Hyphomonas sp. CACIAM 19H1 TaxID=1873716 RepID=UPI000DEDF875|nr:hypothetical protein [Hyphomonas sp. CACIAM 19H1]AXE62819.1 hypothetical protein BBF93_00310 [Hyphomonas sp. CACIAM 19H1]
MKSDFPEPDDIFEELAEKVATAIERGKMVSFKRSLEEMERFHQFLLALNSARSEDGSQFNYAQISGGLWNEPHRTWIRHYRRLFALAADQITENDDFISTLAHVPHHLFSFSRTYARTPEITSAVLDLGPMMVHRLQGWRSKRTTVQVPLGEEAKPKLDLAPSEARAYANTLPSLIGAWEALVRYAPLMFEWNKLRRQKKVPERWTAYAESWPFFWAHLTNTAYCLAACVWNEDEAGASAYLDALLSWRSALKHELDAEHFYTPYHRFLYPTMFRQSWGEVEGRVAILVPQRSVHVSPEAVFSSLLTSAHNDVILLTAQLFLFWTVSQKQLTDIGARVANRLLLLRPAEHGDEPPSARPLSLRSRFLDMMRFEVAPVLEGETSYAADLDHFIQQLDNMTERHVVPGRIYTPSTLHGRGGLMSSEISILAASAPMTGDDGLRAYIAQLSANEALWPASDDSIRRLLNHLQRILQSLETGAAGIGEGVKYVRNAEYPESLPELSNILKSVVEGVEAARRSRLRERAIDQQKLLDLSSLFERRLLDEPLDFPFFEAFQVVRTEDSGGGTVLDVPILTVQKGQLTTPLMDYDLADFAPSLARSADDLLWRRVWGNFLQKPRQIHDLDVTIRDFAFWEKVSTLIPQVQPNPILLVPSPTEESVLRKSLYGLSNLSEGIKIESVPTKSAKRNYIATVNGIDVFGASIPPGVSWLFSAEMLQQIVFEKLPETNLYAAVKYVPEDEETGMLRLLAKPKLDWRDTPIFELKFLPSQEDAD